MNVLLKLTLFLHLLKFDVYLKFKRIIIELAEYPYFVVELQLSRALQCPTLFTFIHFTDSKSSSE